MIGIEVGTGRRWLVRWGKKCSCGYPVNAPQGEYCEVDQGEEYYPDPGWIMPFHLVFLFLGLPPGRN